MQKVYSSHQLSFLPWVGFFHKMYHSDIFSYAVDCQFTSRTWIHNSFIGQSDKKIKWGLQLNENFKHHAHTFKIKDIKVKPLFAERLLKEFEAFHGGDRYFKDIFLVLTDWLSMVDKMDSLWLINFVLLQKMTAFLGLETEIVPAFRSEVDATQDIICDVKKVGADTYLSGPHGKYYLNEALFQQEGIGVLYQKTDYLYQNYPLTLPATIAQIGMKKTIDLICSEY